MQEDTDRDWESLAATDPYWAVLSAEEFRKDNLNAESLEFFFRSGRDQVHSTLATARSRFDAPKQIDVALDFGCGVGRLLFGLAGISKKAVGIDVSPTMLSLCRTHAEEQQIQNIELYRSDDELSAVTQYTAAVDFLTSYIVFQHIPPSRGYRIFDALLKLLKPGGVGVIHVTFAAIIESLQHESGNMTGVLYKYYQRTSDGLLKLVEYPAGDFQIQMNHYNLNELFCYFHQNGISKFFASMTNHAGSVGAELYFQRS